MTSLWQGCKKDDIRGMCVYHIQTSVVTRTIVAIVLLLIAFALSWYVLNGIMGA